MTPAPNGPLPSAIDDVVTSWPDVTAKQVFGHRGYVRGGKMFGFLADDGIAVKAWGAEGGELLAREDVHAFVVNGMEMRAWPILPLRDDEDLASALTALQRSYEHAQAT